MGHSYVFVLEQTRGHIAHARNLERSIAEHPEFRSTLIQIAPRPEPWLERLPGLRTWSFQASWATRRALGQHLAAARPDALFIHTQVSALLASPFMRAIPTVISMDATPANFDAIGAGYGHRRSAEVFEWAKLKVNQRSLNAATAVVAWSHWAARSLADDYAVARSRIRVIRPGVDLSLFRPPDAVRHSTGPVRILFVGGDFARKGGEDLLRVMPRLADGAELDIVTNGIPRLPPDVVCRVHRNLTPNSPELVELFRQADVFALPSRSECFGLAIAEALACGLPIVASPVGAIEEMVAEGINGYLVPPGDPHRLFEALERLVNDPVRRRKMGRASLLLARRDHDARQNNNRIFDLMAEISAPVAQAESA